MQELSVEEYIKEKIKILKQLGIKLNSEQLIHIKSLKTDSAVDRYARDIIINSDGDESGKRSRSYEDLGLIKHSYTVVQIAETLHVCRETVLNWIKAKKLKADLVTNGTITRYVISKAEFNRFLNNNPRYAARTRGIMKQT